MASYALEQRGGYYDDLRAGTIASLLANINRNPQKRKEPFGVFDFLPWSEHYADQGDAQPVHLDDPEAQSALILSSIFGVKNG